MHELTQAAYAGQSALDPPSGTTRETVDSVRADLTSAAGAIAWLGDVAAGCVRYEVSAGQVHVRRLAVAPSAQRQGLGRALMAWVEAEAASVGAGEITLGVRLALPDNIAFYRRLGYEPVAEHAHPGYDHPTSLEMRKRVEPG